MYVCICKAVNEQKIKEALKQGDSYDDLKHKLGVTSGCGKCGDFVLQMVEENRGAITQ